MNRFPESPPDALIDPRMVLYDAPVLVRKEAFLQRICDYCRHGYVMSASGVIPVHKAPALAYKFKMLYQVDIDKNQRYLRKRLGIGLAELLLYAPDDTNADLVWVLLVTAIGEHSARTIERLRDVRVKGQRLVVTGYELVQQPRHGSGTAAAWTWRISDEQMQTWRYRLKSLIRSHDDAELHRAFYSLTHPPGFRPIRQQTRALITHAKAEWTRSRAKQEPWPIRGPIRLPYLRRIAHHTRPLTAVLRAWLAARTGDID
jgi:hypothetical protein